MFSRLGVILAAGVITLTGCSGGAESPDFVAKLSSIHVSPKVVTLAPGTEGTFTALGCFTTPPSQGDQLNCRDVTNSVNWASLENDVAEISGSKAIAKTRGNSIITAVLNGIEDTADLAVNGAVLERLEISPDTSEVPLGLSQQFVATGIFVEDGQEVSSQDLTGQVSWSSAQAHIAQINSAGMAHTDSLGEADIFASLVNIEGNQISDTAPLLVTDAVLKELALNLEPERQELPEGARKTFRSYGLFTDDTCRNISYEISVDSDVEVGFFSSNEDFARMDPYEDSLKGVTAYGVPRDVSLIEDQLPPGDAPGIIRPVVDMSHCSTLVSKNDSSSNAENLGDVTVTASFRNIDGGLLSDQAEIFRSAAELESIRVIPENGPSSAQISEGFEVQYLAYAVYTDGSEIEITDNPDTLWSTNDSSIATVQNQNDAGLVLAVGAGASTITVTQGGLSGSAQFTVLDAILQSITIGPELFCVGATRVPETVASGPSGSGNTDQVVPGGQALIAQGLLSNGNIIDVSESVIWTTQYGVWSDDDQQCADPLIAANSPASVSNAPGSRGEVTSEAQLQLGTSCIIASHPLTGTVGGATAIVLPLLEDDLAATELCEAISPLLTLGEGVVGSGIPIELLGVLGQILQPVLTNLEIGNLDVQDVVHDVVGLVGQLTDPLTPITSPLLDVVRDEVLSPVLDGVHGLLCALLPDASCD